MSMQLLVNQIAPNPGQPRRTFPADHIAGLAASIKSRGLMQAITVRPFQGGYQIVAGECRWRAFKLLGLPTIAAEVVEIDDREAQLRAIVENVRRRDMNPIEEATAFKSPIDQGMGFDEIITELGLKSRAMLTNRLSLLNLLPEIQALVISGQIKAEMALGISYVSPVRQLTMLKSVQTGKFTTAAQVRAAGIAMRDAEAQMDVFGDAAPVASEQDTATVKRLEKKIASIADMVCAGFKDGECVAAQRVSPDRVRLMADKLRLIRKHVIEMEQRLRQSAAQTEIMMEMTP